MQGRALLPTRRSQRDFAEQKYQTTLRRTELEKFKALINRCINANKSLLDTKRLVLSSFATLYFFNSEFQLRKLI